MNDVFTRNAQVCTNYYLFTFKLTYYHTVVKIVPKYDLKKNNEFLNVNIL